MVTNLHAHDALIVPPNYQTQAAALGEKGFSADEISAMRRYVDLTDDLGRCRYFTEEDRSLSVTMDSGVTKTWEMTLPESGAIRDMLGLLRQLFGDNERASFTSMTAILRRHADSASPSGQSLLDVVGAFERAKQGVLDSWDAQPGGSETSPHPPLTVFIDWMYGEYLHSDADKAQRIEQLNDFQLYEWQFHWVAERLAILFAGFGRVVGSALEAVAV